MPPLAVNVQASHPSFRTLVADVLKRPDVTAVPTAQQADVNVLLDFPLSWAMYELEPIGSVARAQTLVVTQGANPAYLDALASYHVSGVATTMDPTAIVGGLYSAAAAQRSYNYRSGLTYMELKVARFLLMGFDTQGAAHQLGVSTKTINAHISNALCKLGFDNRSQLVVHLLGADPAFLHVA